jgi:hypothetical protein
MRARTTVPLVLVLSTLFAGFIGMRAATGRTVLHLVLPSESMHARFIDQDQDGLRLADRAAARGPLTDADGTEVGTAYGDCVVDRRIKDDDTGLWTCSYVLDLEDGDVIVEGLDPRGSGVYEMAILGGTGAYANASGDATFTDTSEATEMEIRLTN